MFFPASPRVIYRHNPLETVICQLRFPPILRIGAELPAGFQDRIRGNYPVFRERRPVELNLPPELSKILNTELLLPAPAVRVYDFSSRDKAWKITLAADALSLTTTNYERWEDFRDRLQEALRELVLEYAPAFFTRIGLRYRNVIRRSALGLAQHAWVQLLRPHIAGELVFPHVSEHVEHASRDILIKLDHADGKVRVQHGLAESKGPPIEIVYLIDADFYTEAETEATHAVERLNAFNKEARYLFRWSIETQLHDAMGPEPGPEPG